MSVNYSLKFRLRELIDIGVYMQYIYECAGLILKNDKQRFSHCRKVISLDWH